MITLEIVFSMVAVVGVLAGILTVVVEAAVVVALLMCSVKFDISFVRICFISCIIYFRICVLLVVLFPYLVDYNYSV